MSDGGGLLLAVVALLVALPSLYLAFLAAVTLLPAPSGPSGGASPGTLRFAILVPAHDEELVIARTVAGLFRLRYPRDRFSVHVVADNCTDATAAAARSAGACVHERTAVGRPGKGAALNWLLEHVAAELPDVDAYVVLDADSELSPNFLAAMERRVATGVDVVQALNLVAVSVDEPLVRIRELAFHLACHLRPLAYAILGASSSLHGNGMCFTAGLARRYRWSESSVVEDGELFLRMAREGKRVTLAREAAVHSVMPGTFRDARSQAVRWERGRFDYFRSCVWLLCRGVAKRDPSDVVAGLGILIPPFTVLVAEAWLALAVGALLGSPAISLLAAASLACLSFYVLRGAALGGMTARTVLRVALWAPAYTAWKLWVLALAAFGSRRREWSRTARVTTEPVSPFGIDS